MKLAPCAARLLFLSCAWRKSPHSLKRQDAAAGADTTGQLCHRWRFPPPLPPHIIVHQCSRVMIKAGDIMSLFLEAKNNTLMKVSL